MIQISSITLVLLSLFGAVGCAAAEGESMEADVQAVPIVGVYTDGSAINGDVFSELTLNERGGFRMTVDRSHSCGTEPTCVRSAVVGGTFTLADGEIVLAATGARGVDPAPYSGTYHYVQMSGAMGLTRDDWKGWSATLGRVDKARPVSLTDVTSLLVKADGGYVPEGPLGSSCKQGERSYVLDLASGALDFKTCRASFEGGPMHPVQSSKTLTGAEVAAVVALASAMEVTDSGCVNDAANQWVSMRHGTVVERYRTSTQACRPDAYTFASGMGPVVAALDGLTR